MQLDFGIHLSLVETIGLFEKFLLKYYFFRSVFRFIWFGGFTVDYYLNMLTYHRGYSKQITINYTDQDEVKIVWSVLRAERWFLCQWSDRGRPIAPLCSVDWLTLLMGWLYWRGGEPPTPAVHPLNKAWVKSTGIHAHTPTHTHHTHLSCIIKRSPTNIMKLMSLYLYPTPNMTNAVHIRLVLVKLWFELLKWED